MRGKPVTEEQKANIVSLFKAVGMTRKGFHGKCQEDGMDISIATINSVLRDAGHGTSKASADGKGVSFFGMKAKLVRPKKEEFPEKDYVRVLKQLKRMAKGSNIEFSFRNKPKRDVFMNNLRAYYRDNHAGERVFVSQEGMKIYVKIRETPLPEEDV